MKDSDKNQLKGIFAGIALCAAVAFCWWVYQDIGQMQLEHDKRIEARARNSQRAEELASVVSTTATATDTTDYETPQLAPGTQTMLGDDGDYHGSPATAQ